MINFVIMKYKLSILVVVIVGIPIVLNILLGANNPFQNIAIVGNSTHWLGFYGSYIGGILTAVIGFATIYRGERTNKLQIQIAQKDNYIKDLENRLAECVSLFNYSRVGIVALYLNDTSKYNDVLKEMDVYLNNITTVANAWNTIYGDSDKKEIQEFQGQYFECWQKLTESINNVSKLICELKGVSESNERETCIKKITEIICYHNNYKQLYLLPLQEKARKWINAEKEELNKMKAQL